MQRFYKYFTLIVLAGAICWGAAAWLGNGIENSAEAQTQTTSDLYTGSNVFVVEDNQTRLVHLVYDLPRGKVHLVQIQKGYNPPVVTVVTRPLGQ